MYLVVLFVEDTFEKNIYLIFNRISIIQPVSNCSLLTNLYGK